MKTVIITTLVTAMLLTLCLTLSVVRNKRTKKERKWTNLIVPASILLLFVGLFVGAGISRNQLRKELIEMKGSSAKRNNDARLTMLEKKYNDLSLIIGRDRAIEETISA